MTSDCPDCKGTRKYTGFDTVEPCKTCAGVPDEVDEEDKTTEDIDITLDYLPPFTAEDYVFEYKLGHLTDAFSLPILWEDDVG